MTVIPLTRGWVAEHLPARPHDAHKGTFGRLLVVAGSLEYSGAAVLACLAAIRAGAGLVTLAAPESVALRLLGIVPEATMLPLLEEAPGLVAPAGWRQLSAEVSTYDALVVGPGLGRLPATRRRTRAFLAELELPAVVDADGLNALAEADGWWRPLHAPLVLTPHPGEFARLGRQAGPPPASDDAERARTAGEAAIRWGQVIVLKGARTVVASPLGAVMRSDVATPALATAGSGDVLSGVIGAYLTAGLEPLDAAACGVAVHGAAGALAEDRIGEAGTIARDLAALLPEAARQLRDGRPS